MNREQISFIKETYQSGTRIRLISMDREPQMTPGLTGEVTMVDDAGQIHVAWENGSSLALICEIDQFIAFSGPTAAEYLRDKYPPNESIWFREELPGCRRAVTIDLDRLIKETDDYAERVVSNTMDLAVATRNLYNTMMIFDA